MTEMGMGSWIFLIGMIYGIYYFIREILND